MLFEPVPLDERELAVLAQIESSRAQLRHQLREPNRWTGSLRRLSFARNVQGSNSIEGFIAALDDAAAVVVGEEPLEADVETRLALEGYRNAMTYVLQIANDDDFVYSEQLLKSLHFMMTGYSLNNRPGLWRTGAIFVQREEDGEIVYEGADIGVVPALMGEFATELNNSHEEPPIITAALAHLNLVMIHPFKDGNGRMARALQSLVLAREGILSPVFMSVEEYLGRNTQAYYDVLAEVGQGSWNPQNSTRSWIRFMLTAHLRQARTLIDRIGETERLWHELDLLASRHRVPDRAVTALFDAAHRLKVRNGTYRAFLEDVGDEITEQTASSDLRKLVDAGLLLPVGERRGRHYIASPEVREIRERIRVERQARDRTDPFA